MSDQNSQGGNNKEGYMAIYHNIEEIFYGPDLGLSAKERVLLCIRHKLLRDGLCQKLIGKAFIIEKTGLSSSQVEGALKFLEEKEIILVHRSKTGKIWNQNQYELHPKKFGKLYNWYKNNPTVRVYEGTKGRSFSKKGVPLDLGVGLPADSGVGVPPNPGVGCELKLSNLLDKDRYKNPSNNPNTNNPSSEEFNFFGSGKKKSNQLQDPEAEKMRQISEAKKAGIL